MIGGIAVSQLRLLQQRANEDFPSISIDNGPFGDNYMSIRTSLGLTAADSLLYAPITVIVEGKTEIVSLAMLLKRLHDEAVPGFDEWDSIQDLVHLISGEGASFAYWCRMARSQGSEPIILVDGDMRRRLEQQRFQDEFGDVPVVVLQDGTEFEDLCVS